MDPNADSTSHGRLSIFFPLLSLFLSLSLSLSLSFSWDNAEMKWLLLDNQIIHLFIKCVSFFLGMDGIDGWCCRYVCAA